ncbi:hypothetical protein K488DRAFT_78889 [Vararia minispora EC-137]|uniref:Uncharacterized protein n=1 Tax=Vararia minispora EC-137 TaxID=1314806 RepID=A0ACB8QJB4_9AGAM|nr:hypothetical protein K488DRAFT_78889 [Vararia minispora EC-137]
MLRAGAPGRMHPLATPLLLLSEQRSPSTPRRGTANFEDEYSDSWARAPPLSIHGNKARKQLVSFLWTAVIDGLQLVTIIILLSLARTMASPTDAPTSEWNACSKPLGAWNAIWTVRAALDVHLAYYHWFQQRKRRLNPTTCTTVLDTLRRLRLRKGMLEIETEQRTDLRAMSGRAVCILHGTADTQLTATRLSAFCTTFTIVWFVMAHIFLYTSTESCRFSSPYLWWLTFSILSIMYIAVAEVLLVALIVFIIGPLLALVFTVALLIMGRHPLQNPHYIKPDIQPISSNLVNSIPLVAYIPPPPDEPSSGPITVPPEALVYPPKSKPAPAPVKKPRFRWLRVKKKQGAKGDEKGGDLEKDGEKDEDDGKPKVWEDNWEKAEYPFVRLEDNRASCAICLLDFEEPKRRGRTLASNGAEHPPEGGDADASDGTVVEVEAQPARDAERNAPRLEDASEGVQPLRLLTCGHVFHQTCLDPWLLRMSGRCPTCQRPVEFPPEVETGRRRRRRRNRELEGPPSDSA